MNSIRIENCSSHPLLERQSIIETIRSSLILYNRSYIPESTIEELVLVINHDNRVHGGLIGRIAWDWLHIELLWVDVCMRGKGHGKALMNEAEIIARQKGCIGIHLNTFSFQAPDFYTTLGYEIFGKINNHPHGFIRYYLQKNL